MDYFIATSNKTKIQQYHDFGCPYPGTGGPDLKEPDADIARIVAYKALMNGPGAVTEDTCLHIENCEYNGNLIRFIESKLEDYVGEKAVFQVALGRHNGSAIEVFIAEISGHIVSDTSNGKAFGFDGHFIPDNATKSLWEIDQEGHLSDYSARKICLLAMMDNKPSHIIELHDAEWNGPWQDDTILKQGPSL